MTHLLTLVEGFLLYLFWWCRALLAWGDPKAPMRPWRALLLLLGMPLFLAVQVFHAGCLLLDEVLFPGYRKLKVQRPLFITGIPRSGTTFLHRTLAIETSGYTTLTTWEALLAPSILQRRLVRGLARLDAWLGGVGARGLKALTRRLAGGLDDIHHVGLDAAEEDYLALLPLGGCFIMLLAFPGANGLQALGQLDRHMPAGRRQRLLKVYYGYLQRHLYVDGNRRLLLSKNAAFGSWVQGLASICPDARFILCVRDPIAALDSQIRSIKSAERLFGTRVASADFQALFAEQLSQTLEHLAITLDSWPHERAVVIDMADLGAKPSAVIQAALQRLDIPLSPCLKAHLASLPAHEAANQDRRPHRLALSVASLDAQLQPPYRRVMTLPHRIRTVT